MNSDQENECTFSSWTFKVEDSKVSIFFGSDVNWWRYEPFFIFWLVRGFRVSSWNQKITKSLYLPQMMSDPKNKGTLFSLILKVEEGKVHLFSWSEFILVRYGNFFYFMRILENPSEVTKWQKAHIYLTFFFNFKTWRRKSALFSWSEFSLMSYGNFFISWGY